MCGRDRYVKDRCVEESWRRNQVCVECENESGLYSTVNCMEESS